MLKHLLKIIWNRKRANFLIVVEIFFSFLILVGVVVMTVFCWHNYHRPLGFSYKNIWRLSVQGPSTEDRTTLSQQYYMTLKNIPEVESFAIGNAPFLTQFIPSYAGGPEYQIDGKRHAIVTDAVSERFAETMGLSVVEGRWFYESDNSANWDPVVINQSMKEIYFQNSNPLGKNIALPDASRELRIVGVVAEYRKLGELYPPFPFVFSLDSWNPRNKRPIPYNLLVKMRPGTPVSFQEPLMKILNGVQGFGIDLIPLTQLRQANLDYYLALLVAGVIIALFLILMVALGLMGVLWQNVTQRTREIGLRRAMGGTSSDIYRQILGELMLIASIGIAAGLFVLLQIRLLHWTDMFDSSSFASGIAISALIIYGAALLCGFYPSWIAARIQPAEALHYE